MTIEAVRHKHKTRTTDLLQQYLHVLTLQHRAFDRRDLDHAETTIRRERQILKDLEALAAIHLPVPIDDTDEITRLSRRIRELHQKSRELLARRSAETAREIAALRIPPRPKAVYTAADTTGTMVDVHS